MGMKAAQEEWDEWYQRLAAARSDWEAAAKAVEQITRPSVSKDTWPEAVERRNTAYQKFMMICNDKP